jgi:hypothetical protein
MLMCFTNDASVALMKGQGDFKELKWYKKNKKNRYYNGNQL